MNPEEIRDPETSRRVRSHAVKHAIRKKRKLQQESDENFSLTLPKSETRGQGWAASGHNADSRSPSKFSDSMLEEFGSMVVGSEAFGALLGHGET